MANYAIVKSGRWGISTAGGNNWSIEGNYISRTVPGATPPTAAIFVGASAGVWSSHGCVINSVCEQVEQERDLITGNDVTNADSSLLRTVARN